MGVACLEERGWGWRNTFGCHQHMKYSKPWVWRRSPRKWVMLKVGWSGTRKRNRKGRASAIGGKPGKYRSYTLSRTHVSRQIKDQRMWGLKTWQVIYDLGKIIFSEVIEAKTWLLWFKRVEEELNWEHRACTNISRRWFFLCFCFVKWSREMER